MARHKLGVLFYFETSWMGGIIYIQNLIRTLDYLEDADKPEIILFYRPGLKKFAEEIEYPYLTKIEYKFLPIWKRYVYSWLKGENEFVSDILKNYELNSLFPIHDFPTNSRLAKEKEVNLVSWFADFQYKHYPQFFSYSQKVFKNYRMFFIKKHCKCLVLSSMAVAKDAHEFYDIEFNDINIFHFASVIESYQFKDFEEIRKKHNLPNEYYIVSNQFHKHKNHKIVIEAIHKLNQEGKKIHVAFTGKLPFDSKAPHILELRELISQYNIQGQITILGLIPRDEQVMLMKNAQAVIQPSFFEGWSTVVEDAMALNVPVIASNIPVNIEQLQEKGLYFDPLKSEELVARIMEFGERDFLKDTFGDYEIRIRSAAKKFLSIISNEKKKCVLQINSSVNIGSSGRIVEEIARVANKNDFQCFVAFSKGLPENKNVGYIRVGSYFDKLWHGLFTLLFDAHGLGSKRATHQLLKRIEEIKPDILHLHNLHGYYLNYPILFKYIAKKKIKVVWTLHDCWSFTGHCSHFENIGCNKWETKCFQCPKKGKYPKSILLDNSENNYNIKKNAFNCVTQLKIVTPSEWLHQNVKKSFLAPHETYTINNGVNLDVFKIESSLSEDLLFKHELLGKKVILCVAFNWSNTKGIADIVSLSKLLPNEFKIVIVGLAGNDDFKLPKEILTIEKTNNLNELAAWYSLARVFVNPTYIDTFPTTNLESLACGTPVITYNSGGSPEAISPDTGIVITKGDIKGLKEAVIEITDKEKFIYQDNCRARAVEFYDMNKQFSKYIDLYHQILRNSE